MIVGIQEQKTSDSRDHHFIASAHKVHFFHKYGYVGYTVGLLDGRGMEIYSINILYIMTMPMGNILAITLMNSQHTVPHVNITA